jgi:hypoxanthine phosphoribosyltransferase
MQEEADMRLTSKEYAGVAARAELLVSAEAMDLALDRMAGEITADLAESDPLVLCLMTGAVIAAGQLLPRLNFQLQLGYLHATRYGGATHGGDLAWLHRPSAAIRGRHVLLVDDILDEGLTLEAVTLACQEDEAASVRSAVLVEKARARTCGFEADYVGVRTPDRYLFGYGLDYKNYFRNVAGIYAVADGDV